MPKLAVIARQDSHRRLGLILLQNSRLRRHNVKLLQRALLLSARGHDDQFRKPGEHVFAHPLNVALGVPAEPPTLNEVVAWLQDWTAFWRERVM